MKTMTNKGFTLIELLAVIAIFGVISTIILSILVIGFRGGKKSDLLNTIRQNGDIAMSQMERKIRYAQSLNTPASCVSTQSDLSAIAITSLDDNVQTTYTCSGTTIASNGASLIDSTAFTVSSCSFSCSQPTVADPPTVVIQFTLSSKTTNNFIESNASIPFQTSVTMRNVNQ